MRLKYWLILGVFMASPALARDADNAVQNQAFGVSSLAENVQAGAQVRRAFFSDIAGNDILAISVVRAPGQTPVIELRLPQDGGGTEPAVSGTMSTAAWDALTAGVGQGRNARFTQTPVDRLTCPRSWAIRVERGDPPAAGRATTETITRRACDDIAHTQYAFDLAHTALDALSDCRLVTDAQQLNIVTRLRLCSELEGDRASAAGAWNTFVPLQLMVFQGRFNDRWQSAFANNAQITIDTQILTNSPDAARRWAAAYSLVRFGHGTIRGIDANRAEMHGMVTRTAQGASDADPSDIGTYTIHWILRGNAMVIERMELDFVSAD